MIEEIMSVVAEYKDYCINLRRNFHQYPELAFQEVKSAKKITSELQKMNINTQTGIAGTGVLGVLDTGKIGPCVLLRFDMDGLPITEETELPFSSVIPGVMHACGHDGHMAIGLTIANLLNRLRSDLSGRVLFLFQPAEEQLEGARKIIEESILEAYEPSVAFACHLWNDKPIEWLAISEGPVMAGSARFSISISGKGGHGAIPQEAVDPIAAGAQMVTAINSIISRNISPLENAVISVTQFNSGRAYNIIPPTAEIFGTIRSFNTTVRKIIFERLTEIVQGISVAMGCVSEIQIIEITQPVDNSPVPTQTILKIAKKMFPGFNISTSYQTMVSEDMAFIFQQYPGCYFFVGAGEENQTAKYGHHHPKFTINENSLLIPVAILTQAVIEYLQPPQK